MFQLRCAGGWMNECDAKDLAIERKFTIESEKSRIRKFQSFSRKKMRNFLRCLVFQRLLKCACSPWGLTKKMFPPNETQKNGGFFFIFEVHKVAKINAG